MHAARRSLLAGAAALTLSARSAGLLARASTEAALLPPWTAGTLDIHHIATGRGNATFVVLPASRVEGNGVTAYKLYLDSRLARGSFKVERVIVGSARWSPTARCGRVAETPRCRPSRRSPASSQPIIPTRTCAASACACATAASSTSPAATSPAIRKVGQFATSHGHVVVRVSAGGASYRVFVLDDRARERGVVSTFGPYDAK